MPFGYTCNKCGDVHNNDSDFVRSCVVRIANVYVKGEYDGCGAVEIKVETTNTGFEHSSSNHTTDVVYAYHEQFSKNFAKWQVEDALLASEIYCQGICEENPSRSLHAFLRQEKDQGQEHYCAPKDIRIQESLHMWHLASLPKALPSSNKTTTNLRALSMNSMNIPKQTHRTTQKKKEPEPTVQEEIPVPEEW